MEIMEIKIPDKLTFRRREVIHLTRLDGKVLDYWEKEFGGFAPVVTNTGDKFYTRRDVELILRIKELFVVKRLDKNKIKKMIKPNVNPPAAEKAHIPGPGDKIGEKKLAFIKSTLQEILTILDKNDKR